TASVLNSAVYACFGILNIILSFLRVEFTHDLLEGEISGEAQCFIFRFRKRPLKSPWSGELTTYLWHCISPRRPTDYAVPLAGA
ncbi:hypothetical protein, partial [Burkholderia vietnamiensis]|uniref:hypothetical protein n=1 Tax=Burkholderia vietnamiensis TaxID=60552 RepID=UPI001CF45B73